MGSYRIEESPNKRAGCSVKACKDHKIKIQKGELRLGTWVDTERFQSWSYRHWGCVTARVLANIVEAIEEDGEPNFDMLDGFEDLSAENQAKVKEAILKGDIGEADKTDHSLLDGEATEGAQNETNGSPEKAKTDTKAKSKKRSHTQSDEDEAPSKKAKKAKGGSTVKEEPAEEKPLKRGRTRKVKEETPAEEGVPGRPSKKAKGRATVKEEAPEEKPAKRSRARKTNEENAEPEKAAKRSKKKAAAVDNVSDEEDADAKEEEETEVHLPAKKARGKVAAANGEKSKRGRKKVVEAGE